MPGAATLRSRAAVAAAAFLAVLAAAALLHRRRRRNRAPASPRRPVVGGRRGRPRRACEEEKPQAWFKSVLADNSYSAFKHLRRQSAQPAGAEGEAPLLPSQESSQRVHPFEDEITSLLNNPPGFGSFILDGQCPEMSTLYNWVDTQAQLEHLVRLLGEEKAFAVDTEQHSVRSFLGYTALMQISTQREDYLIDTIALHDVMGILRPVFANPSICKIFHGADNDVLWLQRDFHIYVVNMFDTAKACEILSKPQKSLAYLLEVYCEVTTDKTMQVTPVLFHSQREDWRLRPLTPEMIEYARTDAHYLLYIASCLVSELHAKTCDTSSDKINFFFEASHRSNMVCMQLYAKEIECPPGASSAASILSRNLQTHGLDSKRSSEVKDLVWKFCAWRDLMARMHDESLRYVLSDQAIAALAVSLPKGPAEVFAVIAETDLSISRSMLVMEDYSATVTAKNWNGLSLKYTHTNYLHVYIINGELFYQTDRVFYPRYVQRNLAKLIEDSPPAIMLLFEPKGRPEDEDNEFYIQSKKNICVGCGEKSHYIRYRIIPSCYRMHFPEHLKSHRSHDIVLLCVDCHEIAHSAAEKYKRRVAEEFGIPLFVQKIVNSGRISLITDTSVSEDKLNGTGVSPLQLRTAAMALLRHGSTMPLKRCGQLMQIVKSYYGGRDVTPEDLEMALRVGMSPHERRRLEKKKGYSFRAQAQNIIRKSSSSTISEKSAHESENSHALSEQFPEDGIESNDQQEFDETESRNQLEDLTLSQGSSCLPVSMEGTTTFHHDTATLKTDTEQQASGACAPANGHLDRDPSICDNSNQAISKNAERKISLLGHGHHGKQVVELLLSNGGEEAINQFCQRWRQIFVEAVHPHYLPSGWNINHSGRRDFGDFSVYKPPNTKESSSSCN
ncbi:Protein RRP6-like 3 [Dichanthelium oligosanthes]|uniref:Protein RRP6-like 3 n=1 Tax=Dichanthelium oligosanthes TaxID=888268 RepID=A0A1E5WN82_9POAL|nr:Protein RRP6-like 3 [Dichanthelium oligosanthes]